MSPTQLSLREMRKRGYIADVVERRLPKVFITKDLFGVFDIVCVGNGETIGLQTTDYTSVSKRCRKIADSEHIDEIRKANWTILVHGWHQPKGPGTRWVCREVDVS